ncbi:MAG TPA: hypothetical protein VFE47_13290, partial [Tepidisphaeraceae bacterium]|nr:hypothetical protein [Tepidisphaeraceae bacterium]
MSRDFLFFEQDFLKRRCGTNSRITGVSPVSSFQDGTGETPNAVNLRTIIFLPHRPVYKPLLGIELTEGIDAWRSSFFAAATCVC